MAMKLVIILMLVALSCASKRNQEKHKDAQVGKGHLEPCSEKYAGYCQNGGTCLYITDIKQPGCLCTDEYTGERCLSPVIKDKSPK